MPFFFFNRTIKTKSKANLVVVAKTAGLKIIMCVPSGVKHIELTALLCQCKVEYVYSFWWLKFLLKGYKVM